MNDHLDQNSAPERIAAQSESCRPYAAILVGLLGAYYAYNLIGRWLKYELFSGYSIYGWEHPGNAELLTLICMALVPVIMWSLCALGIAARLRPAVALAGLVVLNLLVLAAIELDNSWYALAKRHATIDEATVLLALNLNEHFGLRTEDIGRFVERSGLHVVVVLLAAAVAVPLARLRWLAGAMRPLAWRSTLTLVVALGLVESMCVALFKIRAYDPEHSQWHTVAYHNPLRLRVLDSLLYTRLCPLLRDTARANAALDNFRGQKNESPTAGCAALMPLPGTVGKRYDVLLVVLESLNVAYIDQQTMPYLTSLASRSIDLRKHYSSGNATHLGMLGLLFGSPPAFYRGASTDRCRQSPYIAAFGQLGYRTKILGKDPYMDPRMKGYLRNFNQPAFGVSDTQELVTAFSVEWRHAAPKCTVVYYFPTHFPYQHAPEHACFLPEADDDYDYLEQATVEDSQPIRNRYRNCLHQADAWLEMLLQGVDLDQTILLITGDHGEELFERGRMGHASYLDEPQIRVPCVLSIPGCGHHVVDAVTSHVDLLPTVADALGWKSGQSGLGLSLFRSVSSRAAIVANNTHSGEVKRWAVIADDRKVIIGYRSSDHLRPTIVDLYDLDDRRLSFSADPEKWSGAFGAIRRFENAAAEGDAL